MGIRGQLTAFSLGGMIAFVIVGSLFAAVRESLFVFVGVGVLIAVLAALAASLVCRRWTRQIDALSSAAANFSDRDFESRVPVDGPDELSRLATAFNTMADQLEQRAAHFTEIDRVKSEFVSSVSHELRTPLTTIKALTRLLMRGELTEAKRREYLETISVECDRQIDLVLNLLDLSRIEGGVFRINTERVDIASVIESCVKSEKASADKRGHTLNVEPLGDLPPVCADSIALRRVLSNLIENAIKYTPDGGVITLSAGGDGEYVELHVADNGIGIPPEDLPVLFDKFHRGKLVPGMTAGSAATDEEFLQDAEVSGVGLGLYLAHNVMTRMGGSIGVDTKLGVGSKFTLRLPAWESEACDQHRKFEEDNNAEKITRS
jgi:signal transduction histidine kinase